MRSRVALLSVDACRPRLWRRLGGSETTKAPGQIAFDLSSTGDTGVADVRARLVYNDQNRTTVLLDRLDEGEP
jgi:hypothetical protein